MLGSGQQGVYDLACWVPAFLIAPHCALGSGIPHCTSLCTGFRHSSLHIPVHWVPALCMYIPVHWVPAFPAGMTDGRGFWLAHAPLTTVTPAGIAGAQCPRTGGLLVATRPGTSLHEPCNQGQLRIQPTETDCPANLGEMTYEAQLT